LFATLGAARERAARHLEALADPRAVRGWCLGPPRHGWLGTRPSAAPAIEVLATFTALRLARQ